MDWIMIAIFSLIYAETFISFKSGFRICIPKRRTNATILISFFKSFSDFANFSISLIKVVDECEYVRFNFCQAPFLTDFEILLQILKSEDFS